MLEFSHPLPDSQILAGRQGFLVAICTEKTVLHVGCVDSGLTQERLASGELLHQRLATVARELWGVDIDAKGVQLLQEHGMGHVCRVDLASQAPGPELRSVVFDIIIVGEVLEHLPNPGVMLRRLRDLMTPGRTRLVVSVPNAFALTGLLSLARGIESVHPDHNFYFSPATLRALLAKCGLSIVKEYAYAFDVDYLPAQRLRQTLFFDDRGQIVSRSIRSSVRRFVGRLRHLDPGAVCAEIARTTVSVVLYRRTPYWADGLLAVCTRDDQVSAASAEADPLGGLSR